MITAKRVVRRHGDTYRTVNSRKLFDDGGVFDIAHSGSAVLFGKDNAGQSKFSELWLKFDGEMLRFIPLHHVRRDLCFRKLAHTHLDLFLFFG